jgi:U3 small nucleolar ribonucleoprotein component
MDDGEKGVELRKVRLYAHVLVSCQRPDREMIDMTKKKKRKRRRRRRSEGSTDQKVRKRQRRHGDVVLQLDRQMSAVHLVNLRLLRPNLWCDVA